MRGYQNDIQTLNHSASKFQVFLLFQYLGKCSIYPVSIETQAQLPNNQTPSGLEEPYVRAKQFQQIDHEGFEVSLF